MDVIEPNGSKQLSEIVEDWLKAHDFDGLFNADVECACVIGDLYPCGAPQEDCEAGWQTPCDCGGCDWHVSLDKERRLDGKTAAAG